jgi:hypothetical protein
LNRAPKEIKGYDILIWMNGKREVLCSSYTEEADRFMKTLQKDYKRGDVIEIITYPKAFYSKVPKNLRVGKISPITKKVCNLSGGTLQ